jgi:hypothetical protein
MGIFDLFKKKKEDVVPGAPSDSSFAGLIEQAWQSAKAQGMNQVLPKATDSDVFTQQVLALPDKQKVAFMLEAVKTIHTYRHSGTLSSSANKNWQLMEMWDLFMRHLIKTQLRIDDEDAAALLAAFASYSRYRHYELLNWPVSLLLNQLEKRLKNEPASPALIAALTQLKQHLNGEDYRRSYFEKDALKVDRKIETLLFNAQHAATSVKPTWFMGNDTFAAYANETIRQMPDEGRDHWFQLMQLSQRASGGAPSKKFLDEARKYQAALGNQAFIQLATEWFRFLVTMKDDVIVHPGNYTSTEFLVGANPDMVKGFIWMCLPFSDKTTLYTLAALAERAYKKIPGKGPTAASIGNACLFVLSGATGLDGVSQLSRLRLRIKQGNTQSLIEKYLNKAATEQGVSIHEIEDMAVDDHGLVNGEKEYRFDDFKATLRITGVGKTELSWYKPDGSPQKTVPAAVKEKFAVTLKEIKETIKQVELTVTAQRDRVDRMFKTERVLTWEQFNNFYFSHGLMCYLAQKLIWTFMQDGRKEAAIYHKGEWQSPEGGLSFTPGSTTTVSVWHPVFYSVETISNWRSFLITQEIVQPLKQAFREVYLLTDAEINTRTYSNRMAAHLLKQHQFNSLAKTRGWKYSLMGAYDDGRMNEAATLALAEYELQAEFWVNEVNADDAMNDTGIWLYVATDQVRFTRPGTRDVVELADIPVLPFSEIMRDVDLFVGVASVGNDPMWRDNGGLLAYRDYWQAYSFGELNEVSKTRKLLLEKLVPRLKIASVSEIKDKFLVVKGKLRTYKIHIGSTNILMEPNDQYLCIVPDRSTKEVTGNLFLPFEGDNGVSVILSKAMLLAEDDKITDTTITRQINRS